MPTHVHELTPPFADSDAAGVVHFSKVAVYVEQAEHAYLARLGLEVWSGGEEGPAWPRAAFSAEYLAPILPLRPLRVELDLLRHGRSSLTWEWRLLDSTGTSLARGTMVTVHGRRIDSGFIPQPLPDALKNPPAT